jgi:hypothetical protein
MNARNQLLVVLTALMLVCSGGAMVTAASAAGTVDQSTDTSQDGTEHADNESTDTANESDTANETDGTDGADGGADGADGDDGQQPAYVTFTDQTTEGETVVVENVTLASPGFVTIHDSSLLAGNALGSVIGTSEYLEAGMHENVEVTLDEPLEADETLIAMPHRDTNDNQEYDFVETEGQADVPFLTADDEPVTDDAVVTLEGADDGTDVTDGEDDVTDGADDGITDGEDNVTDGADDGITDGEDDVTDGEDGVDDGTDDGMEGMPMEEMPSDELPVDDGEQMVFVTIENLTVENLNLENATVYVLVVGEDIDADDLQDELDNITDGEDNVTDGEDGVDDGITDGEDNVTDGEDGVDDGITDGEDGVDDGEDNVTDGADDAEPSEAFEISDLEAPESAAVGDSLTVTANVSNPSDEERTENVEFRLDGDLVAERNVTLEGDESDEVEFDVDTSDLEPGEYVHMVLGDETGEVAMIELTEETEAGADDGITDGDDTVTDGDDAENETDGNDTTTDESEPVIGFIAA